MERCGGGHPKVGLGALREAEGGGRRLCTDLLALKKRACLGVR